MTASVRGLELVQTHADFIFRHREPLAGVQCSLAQKTNSGRLTRSRMSSWIVRLTFHSRAVSFSACLPISIWPLPSVAGGLGFKSETKGQPGTPFCPSSLTMATLGMATNVNIDGPPPVLLTVPILVCVLCLKACKQATEKDVRRGSNPQRCSTTRLRLLLLLHLGAKPGRIISPGCALTIAARRSSPQATMRRSVCTTRGLASEIFLNNF